MTTKICRRTFWLLVFLILAPLGVVAASSSTDSSNWVLGAQKFTFVPASVRPVGADQIATLLPQLILEQISTGSTRVLPTDEVLSRKLDSLQTARLALFLQLSKEYKTRDALVANVVNPKKLEKQLISEKEKIADIEKQIEENLSEVEQAIASATSAIERENALQNGEKLEENADERRFPFQLPFPFFRKEEDERVSAKIALYKNDMTALFSPSESALKEGFSSWTFEKEVASAKISGLLTGSMVSFGDYLSVTVELYLYPGAKVAATVTEIGLSSDLLPLAERLVRALMPRLSNALPVTMSIRIFPEEAAAHAMLTLDDIVFQTVPRELAVEAAIHTISVSAPGYENVSISYQFEGREKYELTVALVPEVKGVLSLRLKKPRDGIFYANGVDSSSVSAENPHASISINGKSVMGIFSTTAEEHESSAFFYIPARLAQENTALVVHAKPYDRAANIDKRRRRMYTAYSALICSLPVTFYCTGKFTAANQGYSLGRATYDDAVLWQNRSNIAAGISAVCGVWTLWELFRYLRAANEVLPAEARYDKTFTEE